MERSIASHKLSNLVDAENFTNQKTRTFHLKLEINYVTSKLELDSFIFEIYHSNPEFILTQTYDPNTQSNFHFWKNYIFCHKSNHSLPKCFRKQLEDRERKRNSHF